MKHKTPIVIFCLALAALAAPFLVGQSANDIEGLSKFNGTNFTPLTLPTDRATVASGLTKGAGPLGISCEAYGASTTATATANSTAIQAALDQKGTVTLTTPGTYDVSETLVIDSDTRFVIGSGVVLKQTADVGNVINMLVTKCYEDAIYQSGQTNVTMAWTAGSTDTTATVTWTDHGMDVGDYVWIDNVTPSPFSGVFPVVTDVDDNNFVVRLQRIPSTGPTAISGSIKAIQANENIVIENYGVWDQNHIITNRTNTTDKKENHCLCLVGVVNCRVEGWTFVDVSKWGLFIGAARDCVISHTSVGGYHNSDVVKATGPLFNIKIDHVSGQCADDLFSLDCYYSDGYEGYRWNTGGDVINLSAKHLNDSDHTVSGSVCVIYGADDFWVDNILVENIGGQADSFLVAINGMESIPAGAGTYGYYGNIVVRNVSGVSLDQQLYINDATIESLVVENWNTTSARTTPNLYHAIAQSDTVINHLTLRNWTFKNNPLWDGASAYGFYGAGEIGTVVLDGWNFQSDSGTDQRLAFFGKTNGDVKQIVLRDSVIGGSESLNSGIVLSGSSGSPTKVLVENCTINSLSVVSSVNSEYDATLRNNNIIGATSGIFRVGSSSDGSMRGENNTLSGGSVWTARYQTTTSGLAFNIPDSSQTISYASSKTPDFAQGQQVTVGTLTGNIAIQNPTTDIPPKGAEVVFYMTQDGSGNHSATWDTSYTFGGTFDTSGTASQTTAQKFISDGSLLRAINQNSWD